MIMMINNWPIKLAANLFTVSRTRTWERGLLLSLMAPLLFYDYYLHYYDHYHHYNHYYEHYCYHHHFICIIMIIIIVIVLLVLAKKEIVQSIVFVVGKGGKPSPFVNRENWKCRKKYKKKTNFKQ